MGPNSCLRLSLLGLLVSGFFLQSIEAVTCAAGWITYRNYCYRAFNAKLSWFDAETECQTHGTNGHIASIHDEIEAENIVSTIKFHSPNVNVIWIGLHDPKKIKRWVWIDDTPLDYVAWDKGEPNYQHDKEHCAHLTLKSDYRKWNDGHCYDKLSYLCKTRF